MTEVAERKSSGKKMMANKSVKKESVGEGAIEMEVEAELKEKTDYYSFWAAGRNDVPRAVIYKNEKIHNSNLNDDEREEIEDEISSWMPVVCTENCSYLPGDEDTKSFLKNILTVNDENEPVIFQHAIGGLWDPEFANAMLQVSLQLEGGKLVNKSQKKIIVKGWEVLSWDAEYEVQPDYNAGEKIVCDIIEWKRVRKMNGKDVTARTRHGYIEYEPKINHR